MADKQPVEVLTQRLAEVEQDLARIGRWSEEGQTIYLQNEKGDWVKLRAELAATVLRLTKEDLQRHVRLIEDVLMPANAAARQLLGD